MTIVTGLELMYRDSGNVIHFLFFTMQFFPPILKTTIPKYNIKNKKKFSLTLITGKSRVLLSSVQESIEIKVWLLLAFFFCLHDQISSINFIGTC